MTDADHGRESALTPSAVPADQQVAPAVLETLTKLVDDVAAAAGTPAGPELAERLETLIRLLIERGHLAPAHGALLRRIRAAAPGVVKLSMVTEKRAIASPDVDCASLLHLCKGRCCAMAVSLSEEDLRDRRLAWELQQPYLLRRDPDHGYCSYLGEHGRCQVYEDRPATCRQYDCRRDPRVWRDWEAREPAPLPWHLVPEAWLAEGSDAGSHAQGDDGPTTSAG